MRNIPNMLTNARVLSAPLLFVLLVIPPETFSLPAWIAFGVFVFASLTDFFDGWLARRLHQESAYGAMLDPIADKLLTATVIIVLSAQGVFNELAAMLSVWVIILRELFVAGLREYLGNKHIYLKVSKLAKIKTAAQFIALAFYLYIYADFPPSPLQLLMGNILLALAAVLTVITGLHYWNAVKDVVHPK